MQTLDATGLACPQPVILAKKALTAAPQEELAVLVDNQTATENLSRLAQSQGRTASVTALSNGHYQVLISAQVSDTQQEETESAYVVVLAGEEMGQGDPAFGRKLMEGFIYALAAQGSLPRYILCYNRGVALTCTNQKTISDLRELESKGVTVLSCGLCLDFYGLKEQLAVGQVTNMYRICELMTSYPAVRP